ncbi:immunoglobulin-like domain-containing protein [Halobacillus andaensis]|uniref:immunoglobulin-like domain-containing protein n=1 Tax=Halobacillus andaensis TaxID=1176239 RepID=UPI003D71C378
MKCSVLIILVLFLSGCTGTTDVPMGKESKHGDLSDHQSEDGAGVKLETEEEIYKPPVEEINVTFENSGDTVIGYGSPLHLEKKVGNGWYEVPYQGLSFTEDLLSLEPGDLKSQELPLEHIDGTITEGIYRITKSFSFDAGTVMLSAEFEVKA